MSDALAAHTTALESLNSGLDGWATSAPNIVAASIMCLFLSEVFISLVGTFDRVRADSRR
jgi:hypothetical protein